jgi:cytochrome c oxidase subunit IV
VLVLMAMMAVEADYTNLSRLIFFAAAP